MTEKYRITPDRAAAFTKMIREQGGVNIWDSANLSNPGARWAYPVRDDEGRENRKPSWQCGSIIRTITDLAEVEVMTPTLVKRMHVATRLGAQGMLVKLTDTSSKRLERAIERARERCAWGVAWHVFDYEHQDALIYTATAMTPLSEVTA